MTAAPARHHGRPGRGPRRSDACSSPGRARHSPGGDLSWIGERGDGDVPRLRDPHARLLPRARLLPHGRFLTGVEAADNALVNQSFPNNDLLSAARATAWKIAQNAPIATRLTKVALNQDHQDLEAALRWESLAQRSPWPRPACWRDWPLIGKGACPNSPGLNHLTSRNSVHPLWNFASLG